MKTRRNNVCMLFLWIVGTVVLQPGVGLCCSCLTPGTPITELEKADVVIAGRVIDSEAPDARPSVNRGRAEMIVSGCDMVRWSVVVTAVWKGTVADTVLVYSPRYGASCGFRFKVNEDYLIYGYIQGNLNLFEGCEWPPGTVAPWIGVSICSRSGPLNQALYDRHVLPDPMSMEEEVGPIRVTLDDIFDLLSDPDEDVASAAATTLALEVDDEQVVPKLTVLARDEGFGGRSMAVHALGIMGERSVTALENVRFLLRDDDSSVRSEALWAFSRMSGDRVEVGLAVANGLGDRAREPRSLALNIAEEVFKNAEPIILDSVFDNVARLLDDDEAEVRSAALHVLIYFGQRARPLSDQFERIAREDPNMDVRRAAIEVLRELELGPW